MMRTLAVVLVAFIALQGGMEGYYTETVMTDQTKVVSASMGHVILVFVVLFTILWITSEVFFKRKTRI